MRHAAPLLLLLVLATAAPSPALAGPHDAVAVDCTAPSLQTAYGQAKTVAKAAILSARSADAAETDLVAAEAAYGAPALACALSNLADLWDGAPAPRGPGRANPYAVAVGFMTAHGYTVAVKGR